MEKDIANKIEFDIIVATFRLAKNRKVPLHVKYWNASVPR
jgi:hypothetical protein